MKRTLLFILLFLSLQRGYAHPLNTTNIELYLNKATPTLSVRFYIFNLKTLLRLKSDPTAATVNKKRDKILKYIQESIHIQNNHKKCTLTPLAFHVEKEIALQTKFKTECKKGVKNLSINYTLFFEFDKTQQGVMQILTPDDEKLFIFSPHQKEYTLKLAQAPKQKSFEDFKNFIIEGMWHIWEGIDHILFLLMLLVPSVLLNNSFKETLIDVLKVVTAFTLSHSITLSLSMFHLLNPPQQLIETLIAISVLLTALNNIYPLLSYKKEWLLAFGFGFIHGFGFANAMREMNLESINFLSAVLGFNFGVEIGQVVIVLIILPLLYTLSLKDVYKHYIAPALSYIVIAIALLWTIERAFILHFMPF